MQGNAKYGWFTLFGVRDKDGYRIRLGRATSQHVAHGIAMSILRSTSAWRYIDVMAKTGTRVERIEKPQLKEVT